MVHEDGCSCDTAGATIEVNKHRNKQLQAAHTVQNIIIIEHAV
jgi:hypothetical protein